jgi:hypothetical protein
MKRFLMASLVVAMFTALLASSAGSWTNVYGEESPSSYSSAEAVAVDAAGGVIVAGCFSGTFNGESAVDSLDDYVMRLSSSGSVDWILTWDPEPEVSDCKRGVYYELFVILDIYSRYVIAWTVAAAETGELAEAFIADAIDSQGINRDQLTLHADRGTSMTSKPVAQLLVDLGVTRSHSRPSVSNDNPYSEAQFKTLKYCPAFPGRFGSIADARSFCSAFFDHYNHIHRHAGIGLHTPASVHYGTATQIRAARAETLTAAYNANPARFRHQPPTPPKLPAVAWINEPNREALIQSA